MPERDPQQWSKSLSTERDSLERQLREARAARTRPKGWAKIFGVGPAAVTGVVLTVVFKRPELAAVFLTLGIAVEIARQWKLSRTIRGLFKALEDPMDGS